VGSLSDALPIKIHPTRDGAQVSPQGALATAVVQYLAHAAHSNPKVLGHLLAIGEGLCEQTRTRPGTPDRDDEAADREELAAVIDSDTRALLAELGELPPVTLDLPALGQVTEALGEAVVELHRRDAARRLVTT